MTLDLNGATLKLNGNTEQSATMVEIKNCYDSHMVNGIVEGDYFEHDYSVNKHSEWVCGLSISGDSKYCSYKNLVVRFITGYGVTNGLGKIVFKGFSQLKFYPGTMSRKNGKRVAKEGF